MHPNNNHTNSNINNKTYRHVSFAIDRDTHNGENQCRRPLEHDDSAVEVENTVGSYPHKASTLVTRLSKILGMNEESELKCIRRRLVNRKSSSILPSDMDQYGDNFNSNPKPLIFTNEYSGEESKSLLSMHAVRSVQDDSDNITQIDKTSDFYLSHSRNTHVICPIFSNNYGYLYKSNNRLSSLAEIPIPLSSLYNDPSTNSDIIMEWWKFIFTD